MLKVIDNGTEMSFVEIAETYPDNYTLVLITVEQIPEIGTPICLGDNQEELLVLARAKMFAKWHLWLMGRISFIKYSVTILVQGS